MNLGEKILKLRKQANLSQEQLAEQLHVTRQTISKWELGETSPDIKQAQQLSKLFKVSLDELVGNDIKDLLIEKVSNTEKLAGMLIKIIKFVGLSILVLFIINIFALILFSATRKEVKTANINSATISCNIENNDYLISIGSDGYFNCSNCKKNLQEELKNIIDFSDIDNSISHIENYFNNKNGNCK